VLLGGPTPYVLRAFEDALPASASGASVTAAASARFGARAAPSLAVLRGGEASELVSLDALDGAPSSARALDLPSGAGTAVAISPAAAGSGVVVLLGDGHAARPFLLVDDDASGALAVAASSALGTTPRPGFEWRSVGAGFGLLAAARGNASGSVEVFLFDASARNNTAWPPPLRASAIVAGPASLLLHVAVADVFGDGAPAVLLVFADSSVLVLWLGAGTPADLYVAAAFSLDPTAAASAGAGAGSAAAVGSLWSSVAVGAWLAPGATVLPGEAQIMGLRAAPALPPVALRASLLVFGRPEHWLRRRASVAGARAQQEFSVLWEDAAGAPHNETPPVDVARLKAALASTHSNSYLFLVCDRAPSATSYLRTLYSYAELVRFLNATAGFAVDGQQLRVWLGLLPPSEAVGDRCVPPPDSELTAFDEVALFAGLNYSSYDAWGELAGLLATQYPHLVAVGEFEHARLRIAMMSRHPQHHHHPAHLPATFSFRYQTLTTSTSTSSRAGRPSSAARWSRKSPRACARAPRGLCSRASSTPPSRPCPTSRSCSTRRSSSSATRAATRRRAAPGPARRPAACGAPTTTSGPAAAWPASAASRRHITRRRSSPPCSRACRPAARSLLGTMRPVTPSWDSRRRATSAGCCRRSLCRTELRAS